MTSEITRLAAPSRPGLTLVLGADAVGKSTFLSNLEAQLGYAIFEPTSTNEIRKFKESSLDTVVDTGFVNERRNLFLGLSLASDIDILGQEKEKAATTSSALITLASHDLMERIIGAREGVDRQSIIQRWGLMSLFVPENVVYIHAEEGVIQQRIEKRQNAGHEAERFWGFNSPFFLAQYQRLLGQIFEDISNQGGINYISLNSGTLNPDEMIEKYTERTLIA